MKMNIAKWTSYACASLYIGKRPIYEYNNLLNELENRAIIGDEYIDSQTFIHHCFYVTQERKRRQTKYGIIVNITLIVSLLILYFGSYFGAGATLLLAFVLIYSLTLEDIKSDYNTAKKLIKSDSAPPSPQLKPKYEKICSNIKRRVCDDIIYYSGYSPFIGVGSKIGGWDFALDIDKPRLGCDLSDIKAFELAELYKEIDRNISRLNIENLKICNKVFIPGDNIRDNLTFFTMPHGPFKTQLEESLLEQFTLNERFDGKFYKVISIESNYGAGKLSAYLRFFKNKSVLHTEAVFFALPLEIKEYNAYRNWKRFELKDPNRNREAFISTIGNIIIGGFYLFMFLIYIGEYFAKDRKRKHLINNIEANPNYDFGSKQSLNYLITGGFENFSRDQDFIMYMKIIEKRLLNILENFLWSKAIDTTEFRERETNILNNGIIMSGGKLETENLAIGDNAKVKTKLKSIRNEKKEGRN